MKMLIGRVWSAVALGGLILMLGLASIAFATPSHEGTQDNKSSRKLPIVIGHRGASGYRPEHTLAAYQLAINMGADYIEPDLVSTKDGVLVARHENEISGTTDVEQHPEFADRETTKTIDGDEITGWFTEDFTLAELKTLRAEERLPDIRPKNTAFDGLYGIPTLQEVIDLALSEGVGIYPETKHPTYFDSIGLSLEEPLVAALDSNGLTSRRDPVYIQSFEVGNLKDLDEITDVRLVQLIDAEGAPYDLIAAGDATTYVDLVTDRGLRGIARYADGIGVNKTLIVPQDESNNLLPPTNLVRRAHRADLVVHAWTFRNENNFLPEDFREGNPASDVYL
ncbi:MAG: glycerophosphodiester phosphodiesterase, partial [Actinomycetota bacterium]|nr:glycerophosphodiester phosphodiesterase [Actinomycetota bacterium]